VRSWQPTDAATEAATAASSAMWHREHKKQVKEGDDEDGRGLGERGKGKGKKVCSRLPPT